MTSRTISPPCRIVTIPIATSITGNSTRFTFRQDSVLHSIVSQVHFDKVAVADSGAFAGGFDLSVDNLSFPNGTPVPAVHFYRFSGPIGVATAQAQFSNQTQFNNMLVRSGSNFNVFADVFGSAINIQGSFTLAFTPLSEWVNFREPTIAVRL